MSETPEQTRQRLEAIKQKIDGFRSAPWTVYTKPFHVAGGVYYLGNRYVSSFLIDTGEGLILIDTGFREMTYQLFDAIWRLGFRPDDIRHVLLSHAHVDHIGATRMVQERSRARVWLGQGDLFFLTERRDLIIDEDQVAPFTVDHIYDYQRPLVMGNTTIRFRHAPGHTPGTTCFFIETRHAGKPIVCAMHGGLGLNGLTAGELEQNGLPLSLQRDYVEGLRALMQERVDIVLPSHLHNYDLLSRKAADDGSGNGFLDPAGWSGMLTAQLKKTRDLLPHLFPADGAS